MSIAKKCDRCGELYEDYKGELFNGDSYKSNAIRTVNTIGLLAPYNNEHKDLCPECMKSFISWFKYPAEVMKETEADDVKE